LYVTEKNGGDDETRTRDLCRDSERFISTGNDLQEHGRHPKSLQDSLRPRYCVPRCVPRISGNLVKLINWLRGAAMHRNCHLGRAFSLLPRRRLGRMNAADRPTKRVDSQTSDVDSIPIARSINRDDSIVLATLTHLNSPQNWPVLDSSWTEIRSIGPKKLALRKLPVRDRKSVESVPGNARPAATSLKSGQCIDCQRMMASE
jgi:hypothetical protein